MRIEGSLRGGAEMRRIDLGGIRPAVGFDESGLFREPLRLPIHSGRFKLRIRKFGACLGEQRRQESELDFPSDFD
jgi:hypothetical protein